MPAKSVGACTRNLIAHLVAQSVVLELLAFDGQDAVKLFTELQELVAVLFHRDQRAEFVNPVTIGFVHREAAVLQPMPCSVCSMSNTVEHSTRIARLRRDGMLDDFSSQV